MKNIFCLISFLLLISCQPVEKTEVKNVEVETRKRPLAKFEPEGEKVILFVGQELEAIGGLEAYNDGYFDHFPTPGGFTMYTNIRPGDESFGHTYKGLDGLTTTDDWGDSPSNMSLQIADQNFENCALAIGFELVNNEEKIASGEHDAYILRLGEWLKNLGRRPVFLRIGYEFDGHSWNHYDKVEYVKAYRRIKDKLDAMQVTNVAYVWQSTGWVTPFDLLEEWYPGDDYVDWCGYSFFARYEEAKMIDFAREKGKPVFIAEATPTISDHTVKFDGKTRKTFLSDPNEAKEAWEKWFSPFFQTIHENADVIKAISYINCNWKDHPMWKENKTFQEIDARLHLSKDISEKWLKETNTDRYLKASPELFDLLYRTERAE